MMRSVRIIDIAVARRGFIALAMLGLIFQASTSAHAGLIELTSRPATGDTIYWGQIGPPNPTIFSTPQHFSSTGGITGTATLPGGASGEILQCCSGHNFIGNFAPDDIVFSTFHSGPLTLSFDKPLSVVGAQIDAGSYGTFTVQIQAFNQNTLLGTFTENGITTTDSDNSAIFLGVSDADQQITSIIFSLTGTEHGSDLKDFAINQVSIAPAIVPEPGTLALFAFGLLTLTCLRISRQACGSITSQFHLIEADHRSRRRD